MDHKRIVLVIIALGVAYSVLNKDVLDIKGFPIKYMAAVLLAIGTWIVYDKLVSKDVAEQKIMEVKESFKQPIPQYPNYPPQGYQMPQQQPIQSPMQQQYPPNYPIPQGYYPPNVNPEIQPSSEPQFNPQQFTPANEATKPLDKVEWKTKMQSYKK